jgi:hypothetical protein
MSHDPSKTKPLLLALFALLTLISPLRAAQVSPGPEDVLGIYEGHFEWEDLPVPQVVRFHFATQRPADGGAFWLEGSGEYLEPGPPTAIKLKARYSPTTGQIEIWEISPENTADFETNGSHQGQVSNGTIRAVWVTTGTGAKGHLNLRKISR